VVLIDIVMWAKNGELTLPFVLRQIDKVIPKHAINNRILIDDHSTDNTRQIGLEHGWVVIPNKGHGITSAANTALNNVETPTFCSFEQDLFLSNDWFNNVYPLISKENVVVASGVRIASAPSAVRKIELEIHNDYLSKLSKRLINRNFHGQSIDNTVYKTDFIKSLGGFSSLECNAGHDYCICLKLMKSKQIWAVNYNVVSLHLRPNSYIYELRHERWYGRSFREIYTSNGLQVPVWMTTKTFGIRLLTSPFTSTKLVKKLRDPLIFVYYPAFCLVQLVGSIEGKRYERKIIK
jgi:glycosyltransferase involved in cell wall biosynthesis